MVILFPVMLAVSIASTDQVPSCLNHLAKKRGVTVSAYDVSNDRQGSNSISCNFGLTPTEAAHDLKAIIDTSKGNDCESLVSITNIPLSIQLKDGRTERLSRKGVCSRQAGIKYFLYKHRGEISIEHLELLGWRGAFLGSDKILVNTVSDDSSERPHLKIVALGPI